MLVDALEKEHLKTVSLGKEDLVEMGFLKKEEQKEQSKQSSRKSQKTKTAEEQKKETKQN